MEMNKIYEQIYFSCPSLLQSWFVSFYGLYLKRQRYGRESSQFLDDLFTNEQLERSDISKIQENLFKILVKHAFLEVPFYQKLSEETGLTAQDIKCVGQIVDLPIISKDMIRDNPSFFCAQSYLKGKNGFWLSTSGTSGKPLRVFCDTASRQRHYAFWSRFRGWCALDEPHVRATFFGRIIMLPGRKKPPFWRYDAFGRNYLFSSYHMTDSNLFFYYKKLVKVNPSELIGYPSSLYLLAKYCKKNKLTGIHPKAVITTAETLLSQQRELLEDVFDCPVFDQYGCAEMALFVSQCEHGEYHLHPEHGFLEVLNREGEPVAPDEEGRAVCTSFINMAMPLIRYDLGDLVVMSEKQCHCGRPFPVIQQIVGRVDDVLIAPDGRPLGRLSPVFKGLPGVYESQIIQKDIKTLEIKMVTDDFFTEDSMRAFLYEVRKRVGTDMELKIDLVDEIQKDSNGKFRSVISTIQ